MKSYKILYIIFFAVISCKAQSNKKQQINLNSMENTKHDSTKVILTEEEWKKKLTPEQYQVARLKGTERPYTSKFETYKEVGTYNCVACGNPLFMSSTKFESGCGWPSFFKPISKSSLIFHPDNTYNMQRTEVVCGKCNAHLGHVFDDGPPPTGLRYCINGVILDFKKDTNLQGKP